MCGRFDIHSAIEIIAKLFGIVDIRFDIKPNYNAAPSQDILIVIRKGAANELAVSRWGFLPSWAKEEKTAYSMINARAETLDTNKSYKDAFVSQRCLVVADGFYEWLRQDKQKIPHYIRKRSKEPMGLAGLYNIWRSPEGEEITTSTIVTTDANQLVRPLHDRMPVILHEEDFGRWLDPTEHRADNLKSVLVPYPATDLESYKVTAKMNSYKYNQPDSIEPVA